MIRTNQPGQRSELRSIAEYAAECGVCTRTVRRWIAAGLLDAVRLGPRLIRVNPSDQARLVEPLPTLKRARPRPLVSHRQAAGQSAVEQLDVDEEP